MAAAELVAVHLVEVVVGLVVEDVTALDWGPLVAGMEHGLLHLTVVEGVVLGAAGVVLGTAGVVLGAAGVVDKGDAVFLTLCDSAPAVTVTVLWYPNSLRQKSFAGG